MPLICFLVAVSYVPGVPASDEVGRWAVLTIGAACLFPVAAEAPRRAGLMIAAFVLWCAVGLVWAYDQPSAVLGLVRMVSAAVLLAVALTGRWSTEQCLEAFAWGLVASVPFALLQIGGWHPVQSNFPDQAVGLFLSRSAMVGVAVPVFLWCALTRRFLLGAALLPLVLAPGAKQVVAMIAVAAVAYFVSGRRWIVGALSVLSAVGLFVAFAGSLIPSVDARLDILEASLAAFLERPWGWGLGAYPWMFAGYEHAHNDLVELLVEVGPGALLVCGLFIRALTVRHGDAATRAALAALLVSACLWWPLHQPAPLVLAAVLTGGLCGARRRVERHGDNRADSGGASAWASWRQWRGAIPRLDSGVAAVPLRHQPEASAGMVSSRIQSLRGGRGEVTLASDMIGESRRAARS